MSKTFYITTPIFYPNANLHMGHAYVVTLCDVLARYHRLVGDKTYFLTGSDENTGKILKSLGEGGEVASYLDKLTENFKDLYEKLDISYNQFVRTSDKEVHWPGAVALWQRLVASDDIYKAKYQGLYCVGCENFYTEKDLIDGKCPIHLTVPEKIEEENYFFRLSKYTEAIKGKIVSNEFKISPETRKNEILALLDRGLEDVSFSRPKKVVPHGIPVPGDESQVIYVWCDALVNYISALGYGRDDNLYQEFWPGLHVIGKDILRFHAAIWPAMLLSAGLPLPKGLLVHGMITSGGHKMSKSLGNVIDPQHLIDEYGAEAVRYYLTRHVSPFEDGDLTLEKFKEVYNADLANGLGNLVSRLMNLSEKYLDKPVSTTEESFLPVNYVTCFNNFGVNFAIEFIWKKIDLMDKKIQEKEPFKIIKTEPSKAKDIIYLLVVELYQVARLLEPFMPKTSAKIKDLIKVNRKPEKPLFLRKD